jgi:hypothetical protein
VDHRADRMVVCTGKNFQAFSLSDLKHEKTLECISPPLVVYPRQLAFIEGGSRVVGGTDSGCAIVYDLNKGTIVERLIYPKGGLVQIVEVSTHSLFPRHPLPHSILGVRWRQLGLYSDSRFNS